MRKVVFFIAFFMLQGLLLKAQHIQNRLNLYLNYHYLYSPGQDHLVKENDFAIPSLYRNMKQIHALSIAGVMNVMPFLSIGAGLDKAFYAGWEYQDHTLYSGAKINESAIYPVFQLHPAWKERGFFNTFKPNLWLSPLMGISSARFESLPLGVHMSSADPSESPFLASTDLFTGLKASIGIEIVLHRNLGMNVSYGIKQLWTSSKLYNDQKVFQSALTTGFHLRLNKNKRFYN